MKVTHLNHLLAVPARRDQQRRVLVAVCRLELGATPEHGASQPYVALPCSVPQTPMGILIGTVLGGHRARGL